MNASPSRRDVFRLLAAAGALLAIDPAEAALPTPVATFDEGDRDTLRALLDAIYGPGGDQTDALAALAESLGYLPDDKQALITSLPGVVDLGSRLLVPTRAAFAALSPAEREAALLDWGTSPLGFRRQVFGALRQLLLFHAHTDPSTWGWIGYPGPWLGRLELPIHPLRFGEP